MPKANKPENSTVSENSENSENGENKNQPPVGDHHGPEPFSPNPPKSSAEDSSALPGGDRTAGADEETIVKSNFAKVRIENFHGCYRDASFDHEGVCERISQITLEELSKDFPGIKVENFSILD